MKDFQILDSVAALVIVLDARGTIVHWNRAAGDLTGYALEDVRGRYAWDFLFVEEEAAEVRAAFERLAVDRSPVRFESQCQTRAGQRRLLTWSIGARPIDGTEHMVATGIDITDLHADARRALIARDEILGVVAHDLRSPLNAIKLSAALLARKVQTPVMRDAAESILLSSDRANRLIQDLLDVARSEAGIFTIVRGEHSAAQLAERAVVSQRPFAAAAGIEVGVEPAAGPAIVVADAERVQQVFENLIANAIKFSGAGGSVLVGYKGEQPDVRFWVRDTGTGIAPEHLTHLFDRFWQGRPSDRRGAGLGLPICRAIVEAHGGRIWAESQPGTGSAFYFTLPHAGAGG